VILPGRRPTEEIADATCVGSAPSPRYGVNGRCAAPGSLKSVGSSRCRFATTGLPRVAAPPEPTTVASILRTHLVGPLYGRLRGGPSLPDVNPTADSARRLSSLYPAIHELKDRASARRANGAAPFVSVGMHASGPPQRGLRARER
jgi:hypothetical protein